MNMIKDTAYKAISCAVHDGYELAVIRRQKLHLEWTDQNRSHHTEILTARDLETFRHEEFLIAESENGTIHRIRLDHINKYSVC